MVFFLLGMKWLWAMLCRNLLSRIMSVTEKRISRIPNARRNVNISPKTVIPTNAAVTGSKAPMMAVGVDPMHCIDIAMNTSDITVGTSPKSTA